MITVQDVTPGLREGGPRALVLPGAGYSAQGPVLYWTIEALLEDGFRVSAVAWEFDEQARRDPRSFVESAVEQALGEMGEWPDLVVTKSVSSYASQRFVARGIPGIWWTPLLAVPAIGEALRAATSDHLVLGGTADASWRPEELAGSAAKVISAEGGTHSMEFPSRGWRASVEEQGGLVEAVIAHVRALAFNGGAV